MESMCEVSTTAAAAVRAIATSDGYFEAAFTKLVGDIVDVDISEFFQFRVESRIHIGLDSRRLVFLQTVR